MSYLAVSTDGKSVIDKTAAANAMASLIAMAKTSGSPVDVCFIQSLCMALGIDVRYVAELAKQVQQ